MNLLEVKNLSVPYKELMAVKNVSFDMEEGEIISIVGESGSGKSTLIRSILGLLPETGKIKSGNIYFSNKLIDISLKKEVEKLRGKEIGMIFQDAGSSMDPIRTVRNQFIEYIKTHKDISKKEAENLAKEWLIRLRLTDVERVLNSYPFELSGGMKQRVVLAMLMAQSPKLLLADEPTSALDVTVQAQVVKELKHIRDNYNTSIIMVTHNMAVASYLSDKIGVMKDGELLEFGDKKQIIFNPQTEYTRLLLEAVPKLK